MNRSMRSAVAALLLGATVVGSLAGPAPQSQSSYPAALLSGSSHPRAGKASVHGLPATAYASKAPIELSWRLAERPQLGQPVVVTLDLRALTGLSAEVQLSGEEGLEVQATDFAVPYRARDEHWSTQVLVTPTQTSRRYLNVVVSTLDDAGHRRMRGFAVPVVVDPGALRAKGQGSVATDAHGVAVVSMPAREEVSPGP